MPMAVSTRAPCPALVPHPAPTPTRLRLVQRDGGDGGRVTLDKSGGPSVRYSLRREDEASMLSALDHASRMLVAAGASQLASTLTGYEVRGADRIQTQRSSPGTAGACAR